MRGCSARPIANFNNKVPEKKANFQPRHIMSVWLDMGVHGGRCSQMQLQQTRQYITRANLVMSSLTWCF